MTEGRPEAAEERRGWTEMEFIAQLRAAGWERVKGPARIYRSPAGVFFHLDAFRAPEGVVWRGFAARRELPNGLPVKQKRKNTAGSSGRARREL